MVSNLEFSGGKATKKECLVKDMLSMYIWPYWNDYILQIPAVWSFENSPLCVSHDPGSSTNDLQNLLSKPILYGSEVFCEHVHFASGLGKLSCKNTIES